MKEVLIVGSGIGGLSTAIRLLKDGYKVKIFEKNNNIGGKVNIKIENGYKFDLTASILMTCNSYIDLFKILGENYNDYLEFIELDPLYRVFYSDGFSCDFYRNSEKMNNVLEGIENGLSKEFNEFISNSMKKYLLAKKEFLNKPMLKKSELIKFHRVVNGIKINPVPTAYKYISQFIKNDKLKDYLLFQSMYIGINPFDNSNIYTLIPTITHNYGLYYIKGGFYNYIKALEKIIINLGGTIEKNNEVEEIVVENETIYGIKTNKGFYKGDIVVCNADFPYALKNLFKDKNDEGVYKVNNIDKKEYSYSVFIIYLGLKKKYEVLNFHNIYINNNLREGFELPLKGKLPKEPSLYMYYPKAVDNSVDNTLNIMVRVPNLQGDIGWNREDIIDFRNKIINIVKSIKGLEDIEENIDTESYLTPKDLKERFNSYNGTAFGLSHKLSQSIYFRPHIKSKKVNGLYYIGSSTHPGNGVSIILDGSKVVVDEINRE